MSNFHVIPGFERYGIVNIDHIVSIERRSGNYRSFYNLNMNDPACKDHSCIKGLFKKKRIRARSYWVYPRIYIYMSNNSILCYYASKEDNKAGEIYNNLKRIVKVKEVFR